MPSGLLNYKNFRFCIVLKLACAAIIASINVVMAQSLSEVCVKKYYDDIKKSGVTLGIQQEEADKLISVIQKKIGLAGGIALIPCDFSKKAQAWEAKPNLSVREGRYIIYNPTWVREVIGNDPVFAAALFGHELGHFINGHFGAKSGIDRKTQESEADQFAGCAVARMEGSWDKLKDLLSRLRSEIDDQYPDRLSSLQAARQGFTNCGGTINEAAPSPATPPLRVALSKEPPVPATGTAKYSGPAELQGVQVIVFKKNEEDARIENALNSNKIPFSTRSSTESGDYNVITCTSDISVAAVRKLARLLTSAGLKIHAVTPSIYPQLRNRMTVETYASYADRFNPLTMEEIDNLDSCDVEGVPKGVRFTVHNDCAKTERVNFSVYYYDSLRESWVRTYENNVTYMNPRNVTTVNRLPLPTSTRKFFVFAFGKTSYGSFVAWPSQRSPDYYRYPYSDSDPNIKNFRKVESTDFHVTCD